MKLFAERNGSSSSTINIVLFEETDESSEEAPVIDAVPENGNEFNDYLWMENEEEFDRQEMQRLFEEDMSRQCEESMILDEYEDWIMKLEQYRNEVFNRALDELPVCNHIDVEKSSLNPHAEEFIPEFVYREQLEAMTGANEDALNVEPEPEPEREPEPTPTPTAFYYII